VRSAHRTRPRDLAITDFDFVMLPDGVLEDRSGRRYLTYARNHGVTMRSAPFLGETVSEPVRRIAEWALYALCGGAMATAIWLVFFVPCACAVPSWVVAHSEGPAMRPRLDRFSFGTDRVTGPNALARVP
jgi:hypothetical protein